MRIQHPKISISRHMLQKDVLAFKMFQQSYVLIFIC